MNNANADPTTTIWGSRIDWIPLLLVPALALSALPFFATTSAWVTLTFAAVTMCMNLLVLAAGYTTSMPMSATFLSPERWMLWGSLFFILSVIYFPDGMVGKLRKNSE